MLRRACLALLSAATVCTVPAACPTYTHKSDVQLGTQSTLPNGWVVFGRSDQSGLWISDLRSYNPQMVTNTSGEYILETDITDDGVWICYVSTDDLGAQYGTANNAINMIRADGSGKASYKPQHRNYAGDINYVTLGGLWRSSPRGTEVWYKVNNAQIYSHIIDISGATASFAAGASHTVVNMGSSWNLMGGEYGFWGSKMWGVANIGGNFMSQYLTLPNNGLDTMNATSILSARWIPTNISSPDGPWGCGHALSHDGQLALANAGWQGDSCVPSKNATNAQGGAMDHKGFYITPFRLKTDPVLDWKANVLTSGTSIDWCPPAYRLGTGANAYQYVDFNWWHFTNDNQYVTGTVTGTGIATEAGLARGIWFVQWATSTWTLLTPSTNKTIEFHQPAAWVPGAGVGPAGMLTPQRRSAARFALRSPRAGDMVAAPSKVSEMRLYSADGRLMWRQAVASGSSVRLPDLVARAGLVVVDFR
jgi:hypothetical protein